MGFARQVTQMFHEEHVASGGMLERFQALLHSRPEGPPAKGVDDPEFDRILRDFEALVTGELLTHFKFEEDRLFPLLAEAGEGDMGVLLAEEHITALSVIEVLIALCRSARSGDMSAEDWQNMRRRGLEFVELMEGHIQKEDMGMLPALDNVIDETRDAELTMEYSAMR